jgi:hypothetical protein
MERSNNPQQATYVEPPGQQKNKETSSLNLFTWRCRDDVALCLALLLTRKGKGKRRREIGGR